MSIRSKYWSPLFAGLMMAACAGSAHAQEATRIVTTGLAHSFVDAVNGKLADKAITNVEEMNSTPAFDAMCDAQATTRNEIMVTGLGLRADTAKKCAASGIPKIFQAQLGYLTLVLVQKADDKPIDLTTKQIYLALADQVPQNEMFVANKAKLWSDVDEALPAEPIHIIAAPRPGATRRLLEGEAMMAGCRQFPNIQIIFDAEPRTKICTTIRADVITEIDSNPDRVAALKDAAPGTIALTTVDEYRKNQSWLRIVAVDGFLPDRASVNAEDYTLAIPIYAYTNKNNLTASGDLRKWLEEALSEEASGPEGYLEKLGLTILPAATRDWQRRFIQD